MGNTPRAKDSLCQIFVQIRFQDAEKLAKSIPPKGVLGGVLGVPVLVCFVTPTGSLFVFLVVQKKWNTPRLHSVNFSSKSDESMPKKY